ncbi:CubicO group peptidase, beta-lactamase class C family [Friedmanniella luteola]|uniref:CubicO group peptidase, beta-lactamase class C family n=1 Tax=Friedmanniella luteola TaxID=546871 RepID=A0A1H1ZWM4_9ACTN|nr:serine hydrolase domain-containing protein [Friedmanniella luteola]SDT38138.1 CubicO group peptidase, beta-lactamase class C family [Friedmanniella luteola]
MAPSARRRPVRRVGSVAVVAVLLAGLVWWWPGPPRATGDRTGDAGLLARVGELDGFRRLAVAVVDLEGSPRVRHAGVGADERTPFEAGSVTKALTGLVVADAVGRGELDLDTPAGDLLDLGDGPAARVTVRQLVTHHAGLPPLDRATRLRALPLVPLGLDPYRGVSTAELVERAASTQTGPPEYAYSNLGAALAGQAAAAAAGTDYPTLVQDRLLAPLGLWDTHLQTDQALVPAGRSARGRRMQPWVFDGYAPAGATVSTTADLTTLATTLLEERAPGMAALEPLADAGREGRQIGVFWQLSTQDGRTITWHNGRTGGYGAFVGLDRERGRAVVVMADVATDRVDELGLRLARAD